MRRLSRLIRASREEIARGAECWAGDRLTPRPQIPLHAFLSGKINLICAESNNNRADFAIAVPN